MLCFVFYIPFLFKRRALRSFFLQRAAKSGTFRKSAYAFARLRTTAFPVFKKALRSSSGAEIAPLGILNTAKAAQPPRPSDSMAAAWLMPRRGCAFPPDRPGRPLRRAPVADTMPTKKGGNMRNAFLPRLKRAKAAALFEARQGRDGKGAGERRAFRCTGLEKRGKRAHFSFCILSDPSVIAKAARNVPFG